MELQSPKLQNCLRPTLHGPSWTPTANEALPANEVPNVFSNDSQKMVQIPAFSSSAMSGGLPIDKAFWRLPS